MASDSAATFGTSNNPTIGQQQVQKVRKLNDTILYSSTGAIGMSQLISDAIKTCWDSRGFSNLSSPEQMMNKIGQCIGEVIKPYWNTAQAQRNLVGEAGSCLCKSLVAIPVSRKPCLFQFDFNGAPERATEQLPFVALGSGSTIADPFLALLGRLLWRGKLPTLGEGRLAAVWTVEHVRQTNPGGVGGDIQLATLGNNAIEGPKAALVSITEIEEHLERISTAENALVRELRGEAIQAASTISVPILDDSSK